jgi:hypothetical protein
MYKMEINVSGQQGSRAGVRKRRYPELDAEAAA